MNSFVFDWCVRLKQSGLHLVWAVLEELPLVPRKPLIVQRLDYLAAILTLDPKHGCLEAIKLNKMNGWNACRRAVTQHERVRLWASLDAIVACLFSIQLDDLDWILRGCDLPWPSAGKSDPKGFWRVTKDKDPELRHTILTLVAFHDLQQKIEDFGGDREKGIDAFCSQNDGQGWMLPETLCLADYGLGHDERAKKPQPVASRLGPRFYDWQLEQNAEESWRECHLHARNLLGAVGYQQLLDDIEAEKRSEKPHASTLADEPIEPQRQGVLFDLDKVAPRQG